MLSAPLSEDRRAEAGKDASLFVCEIGAGNWFSERLTGDRSGESREFSFNDRCGEFAIGASRPSLVGDGEIGSTGSRKRERIGNPNAFVKYASFALELVFCRGAREAVASAVADADAAAAAAATADSCDGGRSLPCRSRD